MQNAFSISEIGTIFRYHTFPILFGIALLFVALAAFFEYDRNKSKSVQFLLIISVVLLLKQLILFFVSRRIIFSATIKVIPFTPLHNAILESASILAIVTTLHYLVLRPKLGRTFFLQNGAAFLGLLVVSVLFKVYLPDYITYMAAAMHLHCIFMLEVVARRATQISDFTDPENTYLIKSIPTMNIWLRFALVANLLFIFAPQSPVTDYLAHSVQAVGFFVFVLFANGIASISYNDLRDLVQNTQREFKIVLELFEMVNQNITKANNQLEVLSVIVDSAAKTTNAHASILWLYSEKKSAFEVACMTGVFPPLRPTKDISVYRHDTIVAKTKIEKFGYGKTYAGIVAETRKHIFANDLLAKPHPDVEQSAAGVLDIKSLIVVPVIEGDKAIGVLAVVNKDDLYSRFTRSDLSLLEILAKQTLLTIDHFKLIQESIEKKLGDRDVTIAADIQQGLLPSKYIKKDDFEFHGFSKPAKGVGGDYFDMLDFGNGRYGVLMSDVAGKGIPASLVMVMISAVFRTWGKISDSPKEVAERVNTALCGSVAQDRYATFYYYIVDLKTRSIKFTNAAHGPLLVYHTKRDEFELMDTQGMPLGISPDGVYEEQTGSIEEGDLCILYTDGITEAMNPRRDQYSIDRLKTMIQQLKDKPVNEMTQIIYADIKTFCEGAPQHDDETLVIARFK